jgi:hypothetical protein
METENGMAISYDDELLVRKPKDIQLEGDMKSFI